jgi:quinolinate synthase
MSAPEIERRMQRLKTRMSEQVLILAHHYQRDEIVKHADVIGDSFALAKAAAQTAAPLIVFCGVYFMAETADIVTANNQGVFMPDTTAGCSLADCAQIEAVENAWQRLRRNSSRTITPITYINSNIELKAFCGRHGGTVCTSSNAAAAIKWAWQRSDLLFFFPDQHLGRNIAHQLGVALDQMLLWDPEKLPKSNLSKILEPVRIILWNGNCCVHQEFSFDYIKLLRAQDPNVKIIAHPECNFEVAQNSDYLGSTQYIIRMVSESADGTHWGIGTERNLVNRLRAQYPGKKIDFLQGWEPYCKTMNQVRAYHLLYLLEQLAAGNWLNQVKVAIQYQDGALKALNNMLGL